MIGRAIGGTAVVLALVAAVSATSVVPEVLASSTDILLAERNVEPCTGYCVSCAASGHAADASPSVCDPSWCNPDAKAGGGWHTTCSGAATCGDHSCSGGEADAAAGESLNLSMDELYAAVGSALVRANAAAVSQLLQDNPKRLHLEADRQALQVVACDGAVIAHYPIDDDMAGALLRR